jgi:hypothetical protein
MTATDYDLALLGAGAAGIAAARAARAAGVTRLVMVAPDAGATEMCAGWIAGSPTDPTALHWLTEVGLRAPGSYAFASISGVVTPAISGLTSLLDLASLPAGALGVVDLVAGPSWAPELVARSLADALAREVRVISPGPEARSGQSAAELARVLDTAGLTDALALGLRERARGCVALLLPPVLGLARDEVCARLAQLVGMPVGETGGLQGDPTAVRLARALSRAVPAEVERIAARATVEARPEGGARVRAGERILSARAVVLATGGLAAGGLAFDGAFSESCAGAPVWLSRGAGTVLPTPASDRGMDPMPLFAPDAHGRVAALSAGLVRTPDGRVAGPDGRTPFAPWLFAAGAVLAGGSALYGPPLADALTSGYEAGTRAAAWLRSEQ